MPSDSFENLCSRGIELVQRSFEFRQCEREGFVAAKYLALNLCLGAEVGEGR